VLVPITIFGLWAGAACSESPTGQQLPVATTVEISRGDLVFLSLGDTAHLTATVRDQSGASMPGVPVTWTVSGTGVALVSAAGVVTSVGNGETRVTASAGAARADVPVRVAQRAAGLRFSPDPVTLLQVGDTVTVAATLVDANDRPMAPEPVTWRSLTTDIVSVSAVGVVEALADGGAVLEASAASVTSQLAAFVGDAVLVIASVAPAPMIAGDTAEVRGLGFSPVPAENEVMVDGVPAAVVSASSVQLRIVVPDADCRPARSGLIRVAARGMADSVLAPVRPAVTHTLSIGSGVYVTDGCVHLAAGSGSEEYLVGILSAAESAASLTPVRLAARTGQRGILTAPLGRGVTAAPGGVGGFTFGGTGARTAASEGPAAAPARGPVSGAAATSPQAAPDRGGEARIRQAEQDWLASLGPVEPAPRRAPGGPAPTPPSEGQRMQLTVPESCAPGDGAQVEAVVRYVGRTAAFLEDTGNPAGGFTRDEYRAFDDELTATTLPVLRQYFGDFADVDGNDRILVLVTKEVNARDNLAGFVFAGDLVGLLAGSSCATSNRAEIFYGLAPDTAGVFGPVRTRQSLVRQYPPLIAHELTHILQFTAMFTTPGASFRRTSWELEGGATLAEELVGYRVLGDGPRRNLGYQAWRRGADTSGPIPDWYNDWVVDMALYFGFKGRDRTPAPFAPEQCSWIGRESEGNTGPCERGRAVYGVPSALFRWIMDGYATDEVQDGAMMRRLTRSPAHGLAALEAETGDDRVSMLVRFAATLWADDRPGLGGWFSSWNVHDIFANVVSEARLRPYVSGAAAPALDVSVRGASSAYLLWSPPSLHEPTSLRIRDPDAGGVPGNVVLWVLRVR